MLQLNNTTPNYDCQVSKILQKTQIKKAMNTAVVDWLYSRNEYEKAVCVEHCAEHIGITNINNIARIVKADFCRQRICNVCAWRRQSKFIAQMFPVLEILGKKYEFLLATLTIKNVSLQNLRPAVNDILQGYDRLLKRRKIKNAWVGKVRALEITYNQHTKEFHPHIHVFIAVDKSYFTDPSKYISQAELEQMWGESVRIGYDPICHIEKVTDTMHGAVETLKYTFKTTKDTTALEGYFYILKNRRLVSFSGVFAETRKFLKQSDFENILTDDMPTDAPKKFLYTLYKFDATGGVYNYYKQLEISI